MRFNVTYGTRHLVHTCRCERAKNSERKLPQTCIVIFIVLERFKLIQIESKSFTRLNWLPARHSSVINLDHHLLPLILLPDLQPDQESRNIRQMGENELCIVDFQPQHSRGFIFSDERLLDNEINA